MSVKSYYGPGRYGLQPYGNPPIRYLPLGYYLNLITSEYRQSSNFMAWLQHVLSRLDEYSQCLDSMTEAFNLNLAVGAQLDILGTIIGQARTVGFQPSNGVSPVLDDTTYRVLLKARIAWNQWNGQAVSLYGIWKTLFPGGKITIIDNQNMTATIIVSGGFSSIFQDLIKNGYIVPRPQAVLYTYTFADLPIFGADSNNAFIAGADLGHAS